MNILNDTEHRLFLSAMQREKKICEQFDNSCDSGIKLLPICRSIERKVDKAIDPRKGHWIGHREHCENLGVTPSGLGAYEWCSNCDCGIDVREWHRNHYNFCPNCGADMREVKE